MQWRPLVIAALVCAAATPASARLTHLNIARTEIIDLPAFGATGAYEKLVGTFDGEIDPTNPRNAVIVDLDLAPTINGKARYSATFTILKPRDATKANGKLFYMFNNRGSKLELRINDATEGSNDPATAVHFGNGWLNRQGYALAWSGWDGNVKPGPNMESIALPVVRNRDGSEITSRVAAELIPTSPADSAFTLIYRAAPAEPANGAMTVREHVDDPKTALAGWSYDGDGRVRLPGPAKPNWIYEFVYTAKDPVPMTIGYAATRDFIDFLRTAAADDIGTPNPLARPKGLDAVYAFGRSQGGRVQRDFVYWGFNEDEAGTKRRVIDGMMPYATGIGLMWTNFRFAEPTRSSQQHIRARIREKEGPHTFAVRTDPLTGRTDGIFKRCHARDVCPKVMNVDSANEYWNKSSALNHTDAFGRDLDDKAAPEVRLYATASQQHSTAFGDRPLPLPGCVQLSNPLYQGPLFRALLAAMDAWVTRGVRPPDSQVPRARDRTLVAAKDVRFPAIPSTSYAGWPPLPAAAYHPESLGELRVLDFDVVPPADVPGKIYVTLVSQVDADGNERGGVRVPLLQAPLGTYTGWALLKPGEGGPDLCGQNGQFFPFAATEAERLAAGDPRPSLEKRYGSAEDYRARVSAAITAQVKARLMLAEDGPAVLADAMDQYANHRFRGPQAPTDH